MQLGSFSVSLTVRDLEASRACYAELGFEAVGGDASENWLILRNGTTVIGLLHGMFERNMLTFNPGWDVDANPIEPFTDVRDLQGALRARGIGFASEADETTSGPASFVVVDSDGNPILVDQHR